MLGLEVVNGIEEDRGDDGWTACAKICGEAVNKE